MGLVLKARHRMMGRRVALKIMSPKAVQSPDSVRRFQREVHAAARLTHPNIVAAFDADQAGQTHFLVLEYVEGRDLSSLVKSQGCLDPAKAVDCILQAARGLQYAHEQGVIHRDIKPGNLLMDEEGTVRILDMGLARLEGTAEQAELTGTDQIMGTVDYMAPEQAADTRRADARADIYSLGITLWYLLTGRPAYSGDTLMAKLLKHRDGPVPSLTAACPAASKSLEAVFSRMVAKHPDERYQSMTEVIADLLHVQAGAPVYPLEHATSDSNLNAFLTGLGAGPPAPAAVAQPLAAPAAKAAETPATVRLDDAASETNAQQKPVPSPQAVPRVTPLRINKPVIEKRVALFTLAAAVAVVAVGTALIVTIVRTIEPRWLIGSKRTRSTTRWRGLSRRVHRSRVERRRLYSTIHSGKPHSGYIRPAAA
jgi:serine/threonine protein kinase